ncbi:MAG: flagellar basal body P-ring formation protein FlgA [Alphaproteobacteria bacterium]|nr:flagellar basal body P-ring formation protein FlgA [Alphaproteobacteria bacterium]
MIKVCIVGLWGMMLMLSEAALAEGSEHQSQLEEQISTAIADEIGADRISIHLDHTPATLSQSLDQPVLAVNHVDRSKHTFDITITYPAASESSSLPADHLKGSYDTWKQVPLVKIPIEKGQVIHEESLTTQWVKTSTVPHDTATQMSQITNSVAKRSLAEGKWVRTRDIEQPVLVKRNDLVTILYKTQNLTLQSQAIALEDGSKGDRIRLKNAESKKEFMGIVDDQHTVLIPTSG